jgi:hypothetical protein
VTARYINLEEIFCEVIKAHNTRNSNSDEVLDGFRVFASFSRPENYGRLALET